jgi:hypothetical protein
MGLSPLLSVHFHIQQSRPPLRRPARYGGSPPRHFHWVALPASLNEQGRPTTWNQTREVKGRAGQLSRRLQGRTRRPLHGRQCLCSGGTGLAAFRLMHAACLRL